MLKQVIEALELLDASRVDGAAVAEIIRSRGLEGVQTQTASGDRGATDFVKVFVPGRSGKMTGGRAPTLGIIGRLGGIGARPARVGLVSDAEGAIVAVSCALKLADMLKKGDSMEGDVVVCTHISPQSPILPHEPVPFMGSPVDMDVMNAHEVDPAMDAILSVDATKGNRIMNHRGIAISPTVKEGYILRVSETLLDIMTWTTGILPRVIAITVQDITPYGNGLYHMNSIMQPSTATKSPVVGVAVTSETTVPGCAGGANHEIDLEQAARFCLEVAKAFGAGECRFYDDGEFARLVELYGPMNRLQTLGVKR